MAYLTIVSHRYWPRSLIARILVVELSAVMLVAILLPALMVWLLHQQMNHYEIQTLSEQAREIERGVTRHGPALSVTLKPDVAQTYATSYDGRAYVIVDARGQAKSKSAFADRISWQSAPRTRRTEDFRIGTIVGVSLPLSEADERLWLLVTQDEAGRGAIIDDVARAFLTRYGPVLLVILLMLPLINSLLNRRLVVAVRAVSAQAASIGPKTLDVRLSETDLPLEVIPLTQATNSLLVRLEESFRRQSEFVANVAHELRTPLTTLKFELESVEDENLRIGLQQTTDRLNHVIGQLQALAALEVTASSFAPFDLVAMAQAVTAELAPQILANGDQIELLEPGEKVILLANRTLIALALSNLILNATRHTPRGTTISIRIGTSGLIEVVDDGPGLASSEIRSAHQRYWRADNRRSDSAGLGLSIVTRIMEVHDAELVIENASGGGARFVMYFPNALLV